MRQKRPTGSAAGASTARKALVTGMLGTAGWESCPRSSGACGLGDPGVPGPPEAPRLLALALFLLQFSLSSASAQNCVKTSCFLRYRGQTELSTRGPLPPAQNNLASGRKHTFPVLSLDAFLNKASSGQGGLPSACLAHPGLFLSKRCSL